MNICGYTLYGIYSTIGYFTSISGAGTVVFADIFFVYHAIAMVIIQSLQVLYYPRGKNRVSGYTIILCVSIWIFVIGEALLTVFSIFIIIGTWCNRMDRFMESSELLRIWEAGIQLCKVFASSVLELQEKEHKGMVNLQYYP